MINVFTSDVEMSCFVCEVPTRLLCIEPVETFPLCMDCLLSLSSVEKQFAKIHRNYVRPETTN